MLEIEGLAFFEPSNESLEDIKTIAALRRGNVLIEWYSIGNESDMNIVMIKRSRIVCKIYYKLS